MEPFASVPEQPEAKRAPTAALADGAAHAYLLHGPAGVGKRTAAFAFAAALLGDERRVESRSHPDLYLLQPLGEMIRIDEIRALRHDLHMRPFEADRRVYLILDADRMNEEAADALLKDLEEPPPYAVIVLVAEELGPLPADDPLPLSARSVPPAVGAGRSRVDRGAGARAQRGGSARAGPCVGRTARPRAPAARSRCGRPPRGADRRRPLRVPGSGVRAGETRRPCSCGVAGEKAEEAREREQTIVDTLDLPARDADQRVKRAQRGAERDELLAGLEGLESWYRDLVVVAAGAEGAVVHADRLDDLSEDVAAGASDGAVEAAESVRESWRALEEFNLNPSLALEAMFVRVRRALAGAARTTSV